MKCKIFADRMEYSQAFEASRNAALQGIISSFQPFDSYWNYKGFSFDLMAQIAQDAHNFACFLTKVNDNE